MRRKRHGDRSADDLETLLSAVRSENSAEERLSELLGCIAERVGSDVHLYVPNATGGWKLDQSARFVAESTSPPGAARPDPTTSAEPAGVWAPADPAEAATSELTTAPTSLVAGSEARGTLSTAAGPQHVIPLGAQGRTPDAVLVWTAATSSSPPAQRALLSAIVPELLLLRHTELELRSVSTREVTGARLQNALADTDKFAEMSLRLAMRVTGAAGGVISVFADRRVITVGDGHALAGLDLGPSGDLLDWDTAIEGGPVLVRDPELLADAGVSSLLVLPVLHNSQPLGAISVTNSVGSLSFGVESITMLGTLAAQVSAMLESEHVASEFNDRYLGTLKGLATALDSRRPWLMNHHLTVSATSLRIAEQLECDDDLQSTVQLAGLLHDIGLAGVVEMSDGREADFDHPAIGAALIERLPGAHDVAEAVSCHHEWFDGWGYPNGKKGDELPIAGQILAAAEFIAESTTDTSLGAGWTPGHLATELDRRRGTQFSDDIATAAIAAIAVIAT